MKARRLLTVDLSNQVWRNLHAHHALRHGGVFTGALYGFLTSLAAYARDVQATDIVICRDIKPYVRSQEYPPYKMLRAKQVDEDTRAAYAESIGYVMEALAVLGLPVMGVPGYEADDCIARLVQQHRCRFELIVAASSDSDLYQLFNVSHFLVMGKSFAKAMDGDTLFADTGLTPEQFVISVALSGTHNDVEGIPRVGRITADAAAKSPMLMRKYRESHLALIERNLHLIKLPHPTFPPVGIPLRTRPFDARAFYRFCGKFNIEVTRHMLDAFERVSP